MLWCIAACNGSIFSTSARQIGKGYAQRTATHLHEAAAGYALAAGEVHALRQAFPGPHAGLDGTTVLHGCDDRRDARGEEMRELGSLIRASKRGMPTGRGTGLSLARNSLNCEEGSALEKGIASVFRNYREGEPSKRTSEAYCVVRTT
jgi:hypothetical protein